MYFLFRRLDSAARCYLPMFKCLTIAFFAFDFFVLFSDPFIVFIDIVFTGTLELPV